MSETPEQRRKREAEALKKRQIDQQKNKLQREQNESQGARRRTGGKGRLRRKK